MTRTEARALPFTVHATTSNESQAAAITQRLLDQGIDATYGTVEEIEARGYSVRSQHTYAVLKERKV